MSVIVAGIGTGVGKTVVSALLCQALGADYWKPIQAGDLERSDSKEVKNLVTDPSFVVHSEQHRLATPASPHAAARRENVQICLSDFVVPKSPRRIVVELAGGLMVPLNQEELMVDVAASIGFPVVLVANYYLGSINHTLLSLELIKSSGLPFAGIVFNGMTNKESREVICRYGDLSPLADVPHVSPLTSMFIEHHAHTLQQNPRLAEL